MHYTINYNQELVEDKLAAALEDVREYLGKDKYRMLMQEAVISTSLTFDQFCFALSFAGIEGLPVLAVWHEVLKIREDLELR